MRKILIVTVALSLFLPLSAAAQSLVGAWTLEQVEVTGNANPGTFTERTGLMVFTERHYSSVYTIQIDGRRPPLADDATDADRLAAFTPFVAHTGTYALDGNTLTEHRVLDKVPTNDTATSTSEVRFEGADTVWLTVRPLGNPNITAIQKWVRVE